MILLNYSSGGIGLIVAVLCFYLAYHALTRPEIERKHIIRNSIQACVEKDRLLNSSDKIVLIMKQINELKLDEIPQWQKDAFVKAAIDKFKK